MLNAEVNPPIYEQNVHRGFFKIHQIEG